MNWKKIINVIREECIDYEKDLLILERNTEIIPINKKITTNNYIVNLSGRLKFWRRSK